MDTNLTESVDFLDACIRELNDGAADREFTADEQVRFDAGIAELERLNAIIAVSYTHLTLPTNREV